MKTSVEVYELSPRQMPAEPSEHSYPDGFDARSVCPDGGIKWGGAQVFVGEAFGGEVVGIEAVDDGLWHVHLGPLRLGVLHGRSRTIVPLEPSVTHVPGQERCPCSRLHGCSRSSSAPGDAPVADVHGRRSLHGRHAERVVVLRGPGRLLRPALAPARLEREAREFLEIVS